MFKFLDFSKKFKKNPNLKFKHLKLPKTEEENLVFIKEDDKRLKLAKKQALKDIDYFIDHLKEFSNEPKWTFSVKKHFVKNNKHEHMWVEIYSYKNGVFYGKIGNDPAVIKGLKYGEPVKVKKAEVDDWMFYDPRVKAHVGWYSTQKLLK
mgnify:CR=1 FL=1